MELENNFIYRVEDEDTLASICLRFNTTAENIIRNNKDIPLFVGELIEIKVNEYVSHFVKPAQAIEDIATQYNVTINDIKEKNNLQTDKLYIGQMLKIYTKKTL